MESYGFTSKNEIKHLNNNNIKNQNVNPEFPLFYTNMSPKISLEKYDIDPYSVLNISQSSDNTTIRNAFKNLVTSSNRTIKSKACLAYELLFNKSKFVRYGNYYRIKVKDCFYFAIIGDLNSLKSLIK